MKRNLQKLREHRGLTVEETAAETGITASKISAAETGQSDLGTEELYELAVFFETGTSDLLETEELATSTQLDYPGNDAYDGFWGHVGILLYGQKHIKWYPVTTTASDSIMDDLRSYETGFIAIRTLNSRVLFVNPQQVKKIMLNDDDAGAPPDFEEVAPYMAPASYEALREWYWESIGAGRARYSPKVKKLIESLINEEGLDDEKIEQVLLKTEIYYRDGTSESFQANCAHLANIWAFGYNMPVPLLSIPEENDLFSCWYSGQSVALIDTPYLELESPEREIDSDFCPVGRTSARQAEKETAKLVKRKKRGKE